MVIGPFQLEVWHLVIIGIVSLLALWFLWGLFIRVTGTWERVDSDVKPGAVERITFVQFGPFVKGRRAMKGGFQEYSGVMRGRSMAVSRRDHGREMIVLQGFPEGVAQEIDGTITARLFLTLSADGTVLHGTFTPQRIEFTHHPPQITSRSFQDATFRRYKLISRTPAETEVVDPNPGGPRNGAPPPVRRTV